LRFTNILGRKYNFYRHAVIWSWSFGQNRKTDAVKNSHYNINIYIYIYSE